MNTILWIFQGVLAAMFLMTGMMESTRPGKSFTGSYHGYLPITDDF